MKPKPLSFQRAIVPTSLPGDGATPLGHLRGPPDGTDPGGAAERELFKIDLTFALLPTDPTELAGLDHEARVRVTACEWPLTLPLHAEAARLARSRYTPIDSKNASKLGQPPRELIHHTGKSPLYVACVTALSSAASVRPKRSSVKSRMSASSCLEAIAAASQTILTSTASFSQLRDQCVARFAHAWSGAMYARNSADDVLHANERCYRLLAMNAKFSRICQRYLQSCERRSICRAASGESLWHRWQPDRA